MIYDNCVVAYFSGPPCKSIDTDKRMNAVKEKFKNLLKIYFYSEQLSYMNLH